MVLTRETVLVWLLCLASLYCDVNGVVNNSATSSAVGQQDQMNWNLLSKLMSNTTQRTSNAKHNVFSKILLANMKARSKVGRTDDGVYLFQGDIKIDPNDVSKVTDPGNKGRKKRALMKDITGLLKSPIYYQLSPRLNKHAKTAIASAIKEWQSVLKCVKWINRKVSTSQQGYLYFFPGDGCYSTVGIEIGEKRQKISIGDGCGDHGTVVHEIAHALGFWHEQSRPDRDKYVSIKWNNIIPSMRFNFEKNSQSVIDSHGQPYDYDSVMHYGPDDFAKRDGLITIQSLTPGVNFGDKPKLSKLDITQANLLYNCNKGKTIPQPASPPTVPPTQPPSPSPTTIGGSGSGAGVSG